MNVKKIIILFNIVIIIFLIGCQMSNSNEGKYVFQSNICNEDELDIEREEIVSTTYDEKLEVDIEKNINESNYFQIHFIDVGQADATLVVCDGEYMMIDGGNVEDSSLIYSYLKNQNVERLKYIIATHVHEDHIGGLAGALNYSKVETVYCPDINFDTEAFQNFKKYLEKQKREIVIPEPGVEFTLGSAICTILGVNTLENDPNNTSIVMRIDYGQTSFLFSGDAEQEVERIILDLGYDVNCTVLKVPHHGSETSLSYRWLNEAMPQYSVISVGKDNSYGHPSENTLSKLRDADVKVYRTDIQGHIICESDGRNVRFSVEKNPNANTLDYDYTNNETYKDLYDVENNNQKIYILNTNSKKFHYMYCSSVEQMKEENKQESICSREELIEQGYSSCGNCKP